MITAAERGDAAPVGRCISLTHHLDQQHTSRVFLIGQPSESVGTRARPAKGGARDVPARHTIYAGRIRDRVIEFPQRERGIGSPRVDQPARLPVTRAGSRPAGAPFLASMIGVSCDLAIVDFSAHTVGEPAGVSARRFRASPIRPTPADAPQKPGAGGENS